MELRYLTDEQKRTALHEHFVAGKLPRSEYHRLLAQLNRRRAVKQAQMWGYLIAYAVVASALMLGAAYGFILLFARLADIVGG